MIKKLLIANRGEIAVRVIRAARELGIRTVAVFSDADKEALHVALADESVNIGESEPNKSYLDADKIIGAAKETKPKPSIPATASSPNARHFQNRAKRAELSL